MPILRMVNPDLDTGHIAVYFGGAKDNPDILREAIAYLERAQNE